MQIKPNMEKLLTVSPSPHIHGCDTTRRLMLDVIIALLPALAVSMVVFGARALLLTGVCVAACVAFEYLIQRFLLRGRLTVDNLSAVVTGILLSYNLPVTLPVGLAVLGSLVAVGIGKMTFGGLGKNPFNPALVGRVFLLISFPAAMAAFPQLADAATGATPLAMVKESLRNGMTVSQLIPELSYGDLWLGFKSGSFGEVSSAALLLGFLYLLWRRVITWHIPVFILGSMALFAAVLHLASPEQYMGPAFHLLTGGAILGAVYMATDYATSPMNTRAMTVYAVGIGIITILIRVWGAYPEGMSFAILIMNATVPLLDKYIKPRRFGMVKK